MTKYYNIRYGYVSELHELACNEHLPIEMTELHTIIVNVVMKYMCKVTNLGPQSWVGPINGKYVSGT